MVVAAVCRPVAGRVPAVGHRHAAARRRYGACGGATPHRGETGAGRCRPARTADRGLLGRRTPLPRTGTPLHGTGLCQVGLGSHTPLQRGADTPAGRGIHEKRLARACRKTGPLANHEGHGGDTLPGISTADVDGQHTGRPALHAPLLRLGHPLPGDHLSADDAGARAHADGDGTPAPPHVDVHLGGFLALAGAAHMPGGCPDHPPHTHHRSPAPAALRAGAAGIAAEPDNVATQAAAQPHRPDEAPGRGATCRPPHHAFRR